MTSCIIVAAGKGRRFRSKVPKTFFPLIGRPMLEHCLMRISDSRLVDEIILVVQKKQMRTKNILRWKRLFPKIKSVVSGGAYRQESVLNGFLRCSKDCDIILIHDGARPFVSSGLIERVVRGVLKYGSCIPVYPVNGSVKIVKKGKLAGTIYEKDIVIAQTPQGFRRDILERVFLLNKKKLNNFPDESSMCEKSGYTVYTVVGEITNIKITTREDLQIADVLLKCSC
ncbi:MAG: 2-C-methyl-D-erythritol 4-phosphate cytidylyltransferase [bacterium]|nr:2-C-methyl-D-erythritol 4-phosphate cytidylyltransferase [bacterium]